MDLSSVAVILLLFFAAYVICKKNYSFSRVVFLFFISPKLPTLFIQKKPAVRLGQQRSQAVGLGFESLSWQIFLRFILNIFWYPKLVKHYRVPLRSFSALWDEKFSTEKRDTTPPPTFHQWNLSKPENFSKTVRFLHEIFRQCETQKFRLKIVICPSYP